MKETSNSLGFSFLRIDSTESCSGLQVGSLNSKDNPIVLNSIDSSQAQLQLLNSRIAVDLVGKIFTEIWRIKEWLNSLRFISIEKGLQGKNLIIRV